MITDFSIPANHITFIHDWTDRQKPELFRKMNSGEIRILLGSTEKAGTGLNVQKKRLQYTIWTFLGNRQNWNNEMAGVQDRGIF